MTTPKEADTLLFDFLGNPDIPVSIIYDLVNYAAAAFHIPDLSPDNAKERFEELSTLQRLELYEKCVRGYYPY